MIKKNYISAIITILLFVGCGGGGGGGNSSTPDPIIKTISGVVVDGYIKNSSVSTGTKTTTTDDNGKWSITYTPTISSTDLIFATGGIDTSTGEAFQGILKAPINGKDINIVITPLTTLVSSLVAKGETAEIATRKIAAQLEIPISILTSDPIITLKTGTIEEKIAAATAIKNALIIQKTAEILASSVSTPTNINTFNSIMGTVTDVVANRLNNNKTFDEVMENIPSLVIEVAGKLTDDNMSKKLNAVTDIAKDAVRIVSNMNAEEFLVNNANIDLIMESKAKAIEVATSSIEQKLNAIAATVRVDNMGELVSNATKVLNTIVMIGGIEGLENKLKTEIKNAGTGKTIDASTFKDNFMNNDLVISASTQYDNLKKNGFTHNMIIDLAKKITDISQGITNETINTLMNTIINDGISNGSIKNGDINSAEITALSKNIAVFVGLANENSNTAGNASTIAIPGENIHEPVTPEIPTQVSKNVDIEISIKNQEITLNSFSIAKNDTTINNGIINNITTTPLMGDNFTDIKDDLENIYKLKYTISGGLDLLEVQKKEMRLGIYLKKKTDLDSEKKDIVLLSIPMKITIENRSDNKKYIKLLIENGAESKLYYTTHNDTTIEEIKVKNTTDWSIEEVLGLEKVSKIKDINLLNIINHFFGEDSLKSAIQAYIYDKFTNENVYNVGVFLSSSIYSGTEAINFTNDNETINLFENLGLSDLSDFATIIKTDFGMSENTVKGYTSILNISK